MNWRENPVLRQSHGPRIGREKRMNGTNVPTFDAMMNPVVQALRTLGGSGTVEEIESKVAEIMGLSDVQLEQLHNPEKGDKTEFGYRLAWTRTYLKRANVIENSSRGIWALTAH